ncbi:unnamed protein product [Closterium sp. NIES-53]
MPHPPQLLSFTPPPPPLTVPHPTAPHTCSTPAARPGPFVTKTGALAWFGVAPVGGAARADEAAGAAWMDEEARLVGAAWVIREKWVAGAAGWVAGAAEWVAGAEGSVVGAEGWVAGAAGRVVGAEAWVARAADWMPGAEGVEETIQVAGR